MKSIQKQELVDFNVIDFQDAMVVAPIMDQLQKNIKSGILIEIYERLSTKEQKLYEKMYGCIKSGTKQCSV